MNARYRRLRGSWIIAVALAAVACGGAATGNNSASSTPKYTVAFVSTPGGLTDQGYEQSAYEGMKKAAAQVGAKLVTIEAQASSDYIPNLTQAASQADFILVAGIQWGGPLQHVAQQYPNKKFTVLDYTYNPPLPNVQSDQFQSAQGSYLAGIVAAAVSKTHTIGFVGGVDVPVLEEFLAGYEAGALSYDPNVKIKVSWVGSFTDQLKGKASAAAEFAQGADIVYQVAGGAGLGVIAAGSQTNHWVIGVDQDQNHLAPSVVITSVIKRTDVAAEQNVLAFAKGTWQPGNQIFDLKNNGVGIASFHDLASQVPNAASKDVDSAKAGIASGTIVVPKTPPYPTGR